MNRFGNDETRGIVIGEVETRSNYAFHDSNGNQFDSGLFNNDKEAADYAKVKWFDKFASGIEMRVYS